jgi:hypothetical protein
MFDRIGVGHFNDLPRGTQSCNKANLYINNKVMYLKIEDKGQLGVKVIIRQQKDML